MIKTEARALSSMTTRIQNSVYGAVNDLKVRKDRGDKDLVDTYEYGFLQAMALINKTYNLGIEGLEDVKGV